MYKLLIFSLLFLLACQKDVTSIASWSFEAWGVNKHDRGLAHFTEDDSLYLHYQGNAKQISVKVDREKRSGHDRITLTSKDTTFGTIVFIETMDKNKEIRWQLGDYLYKDLFFKRE